MRIELKDFGQYLAVDRVKREFLIYENRDLKERVPFYRVRQIVLTPRNVLNTDVLFWSSMQGIDILMCSSGGRPLGIFASIGVNYSSDLRERQYRVDDEKKMHLAKSFVFAKLNARAELMKFLGLKRVMGRFITRVEQARSFKELMAFEAHFDRLFYDELWAVVPDNFKIGTRIARDAYDPWNNLLNLGYETLMSEIHKDLLLAHLDPYFGYYHTNKRAVPSLVCDLIEPFRAIVDYYSLSFIKNLKSNVFEQTRGSYRWFLKKEYAWKFLQGLDNEMEKSINVKGSGYVLCRGDLKTAKLRAIIKDEAFKLASFIKGDIKKYEIRPYWENYFNRNL